MIKRLIEYLTIERRTEYIQYENSSKSSSARDYTNYSTLKTISIKISTFITLTYSLNLLFLIDFDQNNDYKIRQLHYAII